MLTFFCALAFLGPMICWAANKQTLILTAWLLVKSPHQHTNRYQDNFQKSFQQKGGQNHHCTLRQIYNEQLSLRTAESKLKLAWKVLESTNKKGRWTRQTGNLNFSYVADFQPLSTENSLLKETRPESFDAKKKTVKLQFSEFHLCRTMCILLVYTHADTCMKENKP